MGGATVVGSSGGPEAIRNPALDSTGTTPLGVVCELAQATYFDHNSHDFGAGFRRKSRIANAAIEQEQLGQLPTATGTAQVNPGLDTDGATREVNQERSEGGDARPVRRVP